MFVFIVLAVVLSVQAQVTLGPASMPTAGALSADSSYDTIIVHRTLASTVPSNGFITAFNVYFRSAPPLGATTSSPPGDGWQMIPLVLRPVGPGSVTFTVVGVGPTTGDAASAGTVVNIPVTPIAVQAGDLVGFYGTGGVPFVGSPLNDRRYYKLLNTPGTYACTSTVPAGPVSFTVGSTLSYTATGPGAQYAQGCDTTGLTARHYQFNAIFVAVGITPTE